MLSVSPFNCSLCPAKVQSRYSQHDTPMHSTRKGLLVYCLLSSIGLAGTAGLYWVPKWMVFQMYPANGPRFADLVDEYRKTLATVFGGAALAATLYLNWRTVQTAEYGKVIDRIAKAVDQIGSGNCDVRIGGIHAISQVMDMSDRDYWPMLDLLTAYVRGHARKGRSFAENQRLPDDVQAALNAIARRQRVLPRIGDSPTDLGSTDLHGAWLVRAGLRWGNLSDCDLSCAHLNGADLSHAILDRAVLHRADLMQANLTGASLYLTDLRGVDLSGTRGQISIAQLEHAIVDEKTLLPATVTRPSSWSI